MKILHFDFLTDDPITVLKPHIPKYQMKLIQTAQKQTGLAIVSVYVRDYLDMRFIMQDGIITYKEIAECDTYASVLNIGSDPKYLQNTGVTVLTDRELPSILKKVMSDYRDREGPESYSKVNKISYYVPFGYISV